MNLLWVSNCADEHYKPKRISYLIQTQVYTKYFDNKSSNTACAVALHPTSGIGPLTVEVSRPHRHTHIRWDCSERAISSSQRPLPTQYKKHKRPTPMPLARFKPAIPVIERLQTYALHRAATHYD
jgi:hypothetical protein